MNDRTYHGMEFIAQWFFIFPFLLNCNDQYANCARVENTQLKLAKGRQFRILYVVLFFSFFFSREQRGLFSMRTLYFCSLYILTTRAKYLHEEDDRQNERKREARSKHIGKQNRSQPNKYMHAHSLSLANDSLYASAAHRFGIYAGIVQWFRDGCFACLLQFTKTGMNVKNSSCACIHIFFFFHYSND